MQNLNYLLNTDYYKEFTYKQFGRCNQLLTGSQFAPGDEVIPFTDTESSFLLETTWPGLLLGLGGVHQAGTEIGGDKKDGAEIKLGFTLDYVTGLPIIPGSTVKGILRSAFIRYPDAIPEDLRPKMKEIFGSDTDKEHDAQRGKCVFYDAIPVSAGQNMWLFGLDNITPHSDPLKDPVPLTMLKVLPGVRYLFRFDLSSCNCRGRVRDLFREILESLGAGAKTNVGFGVMKGVESPASYRMLIQNGLHIEPRVCKNRDCTDRAEKRSDGSYKPYCSNYPNCRGHSRQRGRR